MSKIAEAEALERQAQILRYEDEIAALAVERSNITASIEEAETLLQNLRERYLRVRHLDTVVQLIDDMKKRRRKAGEELEVAHARLERLRG